jgi:hypothetical protein
MTRSQYFGHLQDLFTEHIEANDIRREWELEAEILDFIENNAVPEPPDGLAPEAFEGGFADNH